MNRSRVSCPTSWCLPNKLSTRSKTKTVVCSNLDLLVQQLKLSQKLTDDVTLKLKESEQANHDRVEEVQMEYNRLMEDVATATQNQGVRIIEKVESLRQYLNIFEKEKVDQAVYQDFIKELEMLSSRIYILEKHVVDTKTTGIDASNRKSQSSPYIEIVTNQKQPNIDKLVERVNKSIDLTVQLSSKDNDIIHIKDLVQNLQSLIAKETGLEKMVEEIHGFMDYFNDQWNKFNMSIMD